MGNLEISSRLFTYNKQDNTFSGDASTLEHELARQGWTRLDYCAGQWGFHMRSHRTGRVLWFQRVQEHHNVQGELTHVEFHASLTVGTQLKLMVVND